MRYADEMPQTPPATDRREMRLLLVTIAVSVGMLLLLARFRFPDGTSRQTAEPVPAPLERLAASATYDELASIMGNVERRIRPTVLSLAVQGTSSVTYVPAVRLTEDRAVAILPADRRLADVNGTAAPAIVTRDAARSLIVVKPDSPGEVVNLPSAPQRPGPRYVAVAEATALVQELQ